MPDPAELHDDPADRDDPIGDAQYSPLPGLVHRYPDRVLLTPVLTCPAYCRFCFRRARVGDAGRAMSEAEIDSALAYVAARPALREVVLTGGEPLSLPPARLGALLDRLAAIPHVGLLRIHTRLPVSDPDRVTPALVAALVAPQAADRAAVWVAAHVNHPRELSGPTRAALARLADAGLPLVAQTVLLAGVNDSVAVLETLFAALLRARVRPYYLHHPDLAPGTAHFRLPVERGRALMRALRGRIGGLALPTYVLDVPGGFGKVPLGPDHVEAGGVRDVAGRLHPLVGGAGTEGA